jgi:hypothetical protein
MGEVKLLPGPYPVVVLDRCDIRAACWTGGLRYSESRAYGSSKIPMFQDNRSREHNDIDATGAEIAAAKYLNHYWIPGVNTSQWPDVSPNIEVRHTAHRDGKLLLTAQGSKPERPYVLVRGSMPRYEIVGWLYGHEAMRDEWRTTLNGNPVYMVPAEALRTDFDQI